MDGIRVGRVARRRFSVEGVERRMLAMAHKVEFYLDLAQGGDLDLIQLASLPDSERFELSATRLCISLSPKFKNLLEEEIVDTCNLEERRDLKRIHSFCEVAYRSGIHLLVRVGDNQWLKTRITLKNPGVALREDRSESCISVQTNVLPCEAISTKLGAKRERTTEYYAWSELRKEALGKSLPRVISDRQAKKIKCQLGQQLQRKWEREQEIPPSRRLMEIEPRELEFLNNIFGSRPDGTAKVAKFAWCQGVFARKYFETEMQLNNEAAIVQRVSHPHIVHTFGSTSSNGEFSLLMEFLEEDLDRWTTMKHQATPIERSEALDVLLQIAEAMQYLHQEKVVHGDLKPQNILLSEIPISEDLVYIVVKVADFGEAQVVDYRTESNFSPSKGTTRWVAPEVLSCRIDPNLLLTHPYKADVYAFGLIAYQVLTGDIPFRDLRFLSQFKKEIVVNKRSLSKEFEEHEENFTYPSTFISLLKKCWDYNPSERPSFSDICKVITRAKSSMPQNLVRPQILQPLLT